MVSTTYILNYSNTCFMSTQFKIWGSNIEDEALEQMKAAASLPVSVAGALMPDAHVGYGLPIGGVLATENAVIPYGVGVDIACRMMMTIFNVHPNVLKQDSDFYKQAIQENTRFGVGVEWKDKKIHPVLDEDWDVSPVTARMKDKAWKQLGTSGSGNHFVEFGEIVFEETVIGVPKGIYLALLSHSGSRGTGAEVASYYTKQAKAQHPELDGRMKNLAWLDLNGDGAEYWAAMELMGKYASANHHLIHEAIIHSVGHDVLKQVENHHNFAWKEIHNGK
ncbi:MAG: RtcB family protein, partial [Ignavibacteriales bacterium]|nr:RtcB family protein [Ignavibacteriales bacterium]